MLKLVYPACFYPCEEKEGYTVTVPDLPGCVTEGESLAEAIEMASDAASGWVLDALEDGEKLPPPTLESGKLKPEYPNGFISLIVLDIDGYAEKYGSKAVRKSLTIPSWLNTQAERENVNFSEVLQNALVERLHIASLN